MQVTIPFKIVDILLFPMSALEHPNVFYMGKTIKYSVIIFVFPYKASRAAVKTIERSCLKI